MVALSILAGGPVLYDYEVMLDPVTNTEYAAWLNSLPNEEAAKHYCKRMSDHFFGGILYTSASLCGHYFPKPGFEKKPVVFVSWYDAQAYGASFGWRLPTVEEWKKAASWLPNENRFAKWCTGKDDQPTQADVVFYDFEKGWALPNPHLADVDWYLPSGMYGCRGMAGNVGEWCVQNGTDWQPALGGSLFRPVDFCRSNAGEADHPSKRLSTFGFRLVRVVTM